MSKEKDLDRIINEKGRQIALQLEQIMAVVDYDYNRHSNCLVCGQKYLRHEDGLPCENDDSKKKLVWKNRWGHLDYKENL